MTFLERLIHALTVLHPIHPMMVHFPIALTTAALFFILLAVWKKERVFDQVAFANIALAAVSTVLAGATGLYDNQINYVGAAPNAGLKMVLAGFLLLITAGLSIARWRNPNLIEDAKLFYLLGYVFSFGLAITLAFLGGVIIYGF